MGLTVKYADTEGQRSKVINFEGNFGFNINGQQYTVKNNCVFDANNKQVNELELSKATAYQFIGMSNTSDTVNRDYTYTKDDLNTAKANHEDSYGFGKHKRGDMPYADYYSTLAIGNGAGSVVSGSTIFDDGVYTTQYQPRDKGKVSTVSVWMNE